MKESQQALPIIDIHHHRSFAERLTEACRVALEERGIDRVQKELDAIFGPLGHPVSHTVLRNAFGDRERNYVRAEWVIYFAGYSEDVAAVVAEAAGRALAVGRTLTDREELELYREIVPSEFGAAGTRLVGRISGKGARRPR